MKAALSTATQLTTSGMMMLDPHSQLHAHLLSGCLKEKLPI